MSLNKATDGMPVLKTRGRFFKMFRSVRAPSQL
jgi:hypothetical protein